jgi:hypothetical protein
VFEFDENGGVSGRRVLDYGRYWGVSAYRNACAAFVSPPAESK